MLTLERSQVARLLATGDTRWIHRAAYDLMGYGAEPASRRPRCPRGAACTAHCRSSCEQPSSFAAG